MPSFANARFSELFTASMPTAYTPHMSAFEKRLAASIAYANSLRDSPSERLTSSNAAARESTICAVIVRLSDAAPPPDRL